MKIQKKRYRYTLRGVAVLLVLSLVVLLIIPRLADTDPPTRQLVTSLSQRINGTITFQSSHLQLFPRPHITVNGITVSIPEKGDGDIPKLTVYPKIIPLLWGKLNISRLILHVPSLTMSLKPLVGNEQIRIDRIGISKIKPFLDNGIAFLIEHAPGLKLQIQNGKITLENPGKTVFNAYDIDSTITLPPQKLCIMVNCRSNLWEKGRINLKINPKKYDSSGNIEFKNMDIKTIPANLFPKSLYYISRLTGDFTSTFKTHDFNEIKGNAEGSISDIMIHHKNHAPLALKCDQFRGNFHIAPDKTMVQLDNLLMDYPSAAFSGNFLFDRNEPLVSLEITGSEMDVASVRNTALSLLGQSKTARGIFKIVRGGKIPEITFTSQAKTPEEFKRKENMRLDARLTEGELFISQGELDIRDVNGDVTLSRGNLHGLNLNGRLGNSYATNGKLLVGFTSPTAPFFLETRIDADLAQLPPVLKRLIKSEAFKNEMDLVQNCSGQASGKLILGDKKKSIRPRVEVEDFSVSTNYLRTPFQFQLTGKKLVYDNKRIDMENLSGSVGDSKLSNSSVVFDWQNTPKLTWQSESAELMSLEVYEWLKSIKEFAGASPPLDSIEGCIFLSKTLIKGPLFLPQEWSFDTSGQTDGLTIYAEKIMDSEILATGKFIATRRGLTFSDSTFQFKDASLNGSGDLSEYLNHSSNGNVILGGSIGPQALQWILSRVHLPFQIRPDISITLNSGDLNWIPEEKINFSGIMSVQNGPDITIEACRCPDTSETDTVEIKSLTINDTQSNVSLAFNRSENELYLDFDGSLNWSTLDKLVVSDYLETGTLSGQFQASIDMDQLTHSQIRGMCKLEEIAFSKQSHVPVKIEKFCVEEQNNSYIIDSIFILANGNTFGIEGTMDTNPEEFLFDVNFDSEKIQLDEVIQYINNIRRLEPNDTPDTFINLPIKGIMHAGIRSIDFGGFEWSMVNADCYFNPKDIRINISNADLCGIDTPGELIITPKSMHIDVKPAIAKGKLNKTYPCLGGKKGLINGDFNLKGTITTSGAFESLSSSVNGKYKLTAKEGRIYRFGLLAKVFALLNITEIYRGTFPDLAQEGFSFSSLEITGQIEKQDIIIDHGFINGSSMDLVFTGKIDRKRNRLDLTLLVAPLKTVNFIIKQTPLVNKILEGTMVSIPVSITGKISDPVVTALPPNAVGAGFLRIIENTLKLPVTIVQPSISRETEEKGE